MQAVGGNLMARNRPARRMPRHGAVGPSSAVAVISPSCLSSSTDVSTSPYLKWTSVTMYSSSKEAMMR